MSRCVQFRDTVGEIGVELALFGGVQKGVLELVQGTAGNALSGGGADYRHAAHVLPNMETRRGKLNAGDGDREKDRRAKKRKRGVNWKQGGEN